MSKCRPAAERNARDRSGERGAALITVLLLSMLLLTLGGALIISTASSVTNAADAMPEAQAYYSAETGLQAALSALRGNAVPAPTFAPVTPGAPFPDDNNKLSFRGAVTGSISNLSTDPTTAGFPNRLSRWIAYNYTPAGLGYADRVVISPSAATYTPQNGLAYKLAVADMDNSTAITYSTSGLFTGGGMSFTTNTGTTNFVTITFTPQATTTVNAASPITSGLGTFKIIRGGTGASMPAGTQINLRLEVTAPYSGYIILSGTITGKVTQTASTLKITFSNISARVNGTQFKLPVNPVPLSATVAAGAAFPDFPLQATVTAPDPRNLLVTSTGHGPRASLKILEMVVGRYSFYLDPPAPIVIRGSDTPTDTMTFSLGSSAAKLYSGKDASGKQAQLPAIAISLHDWTAGNNGVKQGSTVVDPKFAILDINTIPAPWPSYLTPVPSYSASPGQAAMPAQARTPDFLRTVTDARKFLDDLQAQAQQKGRYYTTFNGYASSGNSLATVNSPAFTFVNGDCTLSGGSGLLVVTGTLTLNGNNDFRGVILVLGNGRVIRTGTGNGRVLGSWMVAKFTRTGTSGFTAPYFDVSGGGSGAFQNDTDANEGAQRTAGSIVLGVAEK